MRYKTFVGTATPPDGVIYAGDLNAIQDLYAAKSDFAQGIDLNTLRVGSSDLQLLKYGAGEFRMTGSLRTDGIIRPGNGIGFSDGSVQLTAAPGPLLTVPQFLAADPTVTPIVDVTDSLTAPTWVWRLRYSAGISDSYKWLFVGGSDYWAANGILNSPSGSYQDHVGGDWTTFLAGDYDGGNYANAGESADAQLYTDIHKTSGSGTMDTLMHGQISITAGKSNNNGPFVGFSLSAGRWKASGLSRGAVLKTQSFGAPGTGLNAQDSRIWGRPRRVSQA